MWPGKARPHGFNARIGQKGARDVERTAMTHSPGESFKRQRCNQCRCAQARYVKTADEYLCEVCEEYALKEMVE